MTFFDTSTLIGVLLASHPKHKECFALFEGTRSRITDAHALAEVFSALTGSYKVPNDVAAELTLGLQARIDVQPLSLLDYETALTEARKRGVMGGGIYDALHATFARRNTARRIVTRDPGNFSHVAPDIEIVIP